MADKLNWQQIDADSLKGNTAKAYDAYVEARKAAKAKKDDFEALCRVDLVKAEVVPEDEAERIVFGYSFGRLSVALAPEKAKKAKPANLISL